MSGNAALSAARKRRASSSPMGAGGGAQPTQSSAYYNRTTPTAQQLMNQTFPEHNSQPQYTLPREASPNVPINIYENIELIKQQIVARTKTIQTQGSVIPQDKLRILQKQNEIQTQILKQKMAIAQQMEQAEQQQQQQNAQELQQQMVIPSMNEPEFIYEKGIPRKNPKYKSAAEIEAMKQARAQAKVPAQAQAQTPAQAQSQAPSRMTPFVSMISDTGAIPPPIVILKSHDAKLEEHDNVIQDIIHQLDYLLERVSSNGGLPSIQEASTGTTAAAPADDAADDAADDEPEQELLMEVVMNDLTNSREFVEGIVDKIVNDTNLSEVIMKIEPLVKENQELRSLIHSQQQMMNEMNTMLLRLLNSQSQSQSQSTEPEESQQEVFQDEGLDVDGLYQADAPEMTEIILSISDHQDIEPAQIIDLDDTEPAEEPAEDAEEPAEPTEEPAEPAEEPAEPAEEPEEPAEPAEEAEDVAESYSEMPHFPIALIVNEI